MKQKYTSQAIREKLFSLTDLSYKSFASSLIPTLSPELFIGVRTPKLRRLAVEMTREGVCDAFLCDLPHKYYEENNLHAFIICEMKYESCIEQLNRFLPFVDNWATCDSLRPKCFREHRSELKREISRWLLSGHIYTVRFAIEMLMVHYLGESFEAEFFDTVSAIRTDDYYVNMMIAWYFATALAERYEDALPYLEKRMLSPWVHSKAISKARESYRITKEQKQYLEKLK